jgi:hypothetical protein
MFYGDIGGPHNKKGKGDLVEKYNYTGIWSVIRNMYISSS